MVKVWMWPSHTFLNFLCFNMKQERFLNSSRRPRFREFQFVVVLLIMTHELVYKGYCFAPTAVPSSPRTTKYTEIQPKKFSRNTSNDDQRKQDCGSLEPSKVSASIITVYPSRETPNSLKIGNQTKTGPGHNIGCSDGQQKDTDCPRFVDTYSSFYLKVGTKTSLLNLIIIQSRRAILKTSRHFSFCVEMANDWSIK